MQKNNNSDFIDETSLQANLEGYFDFIDDNVLKKNVAIAFSYIIFLIEVIDKHKPNKIIKSSIRKNMVIYTGTIIESCLQYCLQKNIISKKINEEDVFDNSWEEEKSSAKDIFKINSNKKIVGVIKNKTMRKFTDKTDFIYINRACKKAEILTEKLFKEAEELRTERNKIHIKSLVYIEDSYTRAETDKFFKYANNILNRIKEKC
jgi:hypothetical protein